MKNKLLALIFGYAIALLVAFTIMFLMIQAAVFLDAVIPPT